MDTKFWGKIKGWKILFINIFTHEIGKYCHYLILVAEDLGAAQGTFPWKHSLGITTHVYLPESNTMGISWESLHNSETKALLNHSCAQFTSIWVSTVTGNFSKLTGTSFIFIWMYMSTHTRNMILQHKRPQFLYTWISFPWCKQWCLVHPECKQD